MILVVGGAYQGKTEFVKKKWNISENEIYSKDIITDDIKNYRVINRFHIIAKNSGKSPEELFNIVKDCEIVISDETGCGTVPAGREERQLREITGRALCLIAEISSEVYRVCCSYAVKIKE